MKKFLLITGIISALSLSVPTDLSFANTQTKKQVVQGKAKQVKENKVSRAKTKTAKKASRKNVAKGKSKTKKVVYKKPRYAKNINKPQEGELLKLEGMVKDLNEQ